MTVTLIIPTHFRHGHLPRVINYYKNEKWDIIIADSTDTAYPEDLLYPNMRYLHYPKLSFQDKMKNVLEHVKTPMVLLCADDDFIVKSSIDRCVDFLNQNQDYASVQGHYIFFNNSNPISIHPGYLAIIGMDINADRAGERVIQQMEPYMHHYYSLQRTNVLKDFYQNISPLIKNPPFHEWAHVIVSVIAGKHKVVPILYGVRDGFPINKESPSIISLLDSSSGRKELKGYMDLLACYLSQRGGETIESSRACLESVFSMYVENSKNHIEKIKKNRKNFRVLVGDIIRKLKVIPWIGEALLKIRNSRYEKLTSTTTGYPFVDLAAKKQWEEIESYIMKHGLDYEKATKLYLKNWYS